MPKSNRPQVNKKIYQSMPVEIKGVDVENATLEAIFSNQKEDRHGDTVMQDGWDLKAYKKNPVILNSHNYNDAAEVIGKASNLKIENKQLTGKIKFAVNENPKAKVIFDLYAGGFLSAFSVGFMVKKFKDDDYYTIEEAELLEVSAVSVPANAYALAKQKGIDVDALDEEEVETPENEDGDDDASIDENDATTKKVYVQKKALDGTTACLDCGTDISEEEKQFDRATDEDNVVEVVCEKCLECKNHHDENEDDDQDSEEDTTSKLKRKVAIRRKLNAYRRTPRQLYLERAKNAIQDVIDDQITAQKEEVKKKIRARKLNQAIRNLLKAK